MSALTKPQAKLLRGRIRALRALGTDQNSLDPTRTVTYAATQLRISKKTLEGITPEQAEWLWS